MLTYRYAKIINHKEEETNHSIRFRLHCRKGVKGSTVRQIAKLADMTPGQIRYYFPNHSELLNLCNVYSRIKSKEEN